MVHAEASTFATGITKEEAYAQVLEQAEVLMEGQRNWVCNLANAASLLWHAYKSLPSPARDVNWAGFYTREPSPPSSSSSFSSSSSDSPSRPPTLILAPFHGPVACQTIPFTHGVCGRAAASQRTQLVPDVEAFPGHIACDAASRSEIVVPIIVAGRTVAVLDVDCAVVGGFDEVDRKGLEGLAALLAGGCDW